MRKDIIVTTWRKAVFIHFIPFACSPWPLPELPQIKKNIFAEA